MNNPHVTPARFQRSILAVAVGLAVANMACAEINEEVEQLVNPDSSISAGIGNISATGQRFGMYNGLSGIHDNGVVGLLDFSYIRRNDDTGTWYRASGRNLGLNTRELHIEHERQGNWRYFLDYNEISRVSPYSVITGVTGIGTSQLSVPSTAATSNQFTLKTERQRTTFGLSAALMDKVQLRLKLQNEEKSGERLFGRGTSTSMEFLAEPIQYNTRQIDLAIDYTGEKFQLSGGYYGSFFNNENPVLRVAGGAGAFNPTAANTVSFDNIALSPDNHAHQFHLAGGYQFSRTTRMNFKIAKSFAVQNDDFMSVRFNDALRTNANTSGRTNLGGKIETTLANLSLTSRPTNNLSLLGNLRYEDRDDSTSIARYITATSVATLPTPPTAPPVIGTLSGTSTTDGYNEPRSLTNWSGKLEANYALPDGYQVTGGIDVDSKERSMSGVRVVGYRTKVDETTYRVELKRAMAETLTGSLAYMFSERTGSDYRNLLTLNGTNPYPTYTGATSCGQSIAAANPAISRCGLLQPIYMADRDRQKIRLLTDWSPFDQLSLQLMVEGASDSYGKGRGTPDIGVRNGDASLISLDATYQASDLWTFNTWLSRSESRIDQATIASVTAMSNAGAIVWSSRQKNSVDSLGLGARGKLPKGIEVGADLIYANDRTSYGMSKENYAAFTSTAKPGSLPDISYRQQTLKLFGIYPVDKRLKIRLDYMLDHRNMDDWTWNNWVYTDGTRIVANPDSTVHFVGLSMLYTFQ